MTQFAIPNADPIASLTFDEVVTVDISSLTGFGDYISLACPEFPQTKISLTESFVDFTSNSKGDFGVGPTDSLAFNVAETVTEGTDAELKFPIFALTTIDKSSVTGVRFRIKATEECQFRCLSIRACAESWQFSTIDLDTLWHRLHRPPSPTGSSTAVPTLTFPTVFRSAAINGLSDPKPVNLSVGAAFTTGSLALASGTNKNEFALLFREVPKDNQLMIEMEAKTMGDLDAGEGQPDFGKALYVARTQEEIDLYNQEGLDKLTQFGIERRQDISEQTWMEVRLKWGQEFGSNELQIVDSDGLGYKWEGVTLEASNHSNLDKGRYILIATIQDDWMRAEIWQLNQVGQFVSNTPVFDTGVVADDNRIKRRTGRFGWYANLLDGDAYIENVKTRGTNFGEMVTKEYRSITPVKGVSLFAGSTAEKELITGVEQTDPASTKLSLDPNATSSGKALKIESAPLKSLQGIASNTFLIDDPSNIRVSFDLKFPQIEGHGGELIAFLLGPNSNTYMVGITNFERGTWTHVKVKLPEEMYQTGPYKFVLMQTLPVTATTWWIDNLSAKTYTVKWSARPHKPDAWGLEEENWQEAGFTLNSLNGGIVFPEIGNGLQIRAQALRQDAVISEFKAVPLYAQLGRFVFRDED